MDLSCVQASRLYAHSLALPARCSQRCDGHSQKHCLMLEINLLWNSYGLSQTIETCSTQHLYQKNSFAVKSVVHSGMTFLPGRPLTKTRMHTWRSRCSKNGPKSYTFSWTYISNRIERHLPFYVAALTIERGDFRTGHKSSNNWSSSVYLCYIWKTLSNKVGFKYRLLQIEKHRDSTALVRGAGLRRSTASGLHLLCSVAGRK